MIASNLRLQTKKTTRMSDLNYVLVDTSSNFQEELLAFYIRFYVSTVVWSSCKTIVSSLQELDSSMSIASLSKLSSRCRVTDNLKWAIFANENEPVQLLKWRAFFPLTTSLVYYVSSSKPDSIRISQPIEANTIHLIIKGKIYTMAQN